MPRWRHVIGCGDVQGEEPKEEKVLGIVSWHS